MGVQLFAHGTYTAVAQVVDIIHFALAIGQQNEVFDDRDDIVFGQYFFVQREIQAQAAVDLITANFAEVVTFIAEE